MAGLVHIYCGDGKGKTTASVGLAVRAAGSGMNVIFAQFLKGGHTGELVSFEKLENVKVIRPNQDLGFSFAMDDEEKQACRDEHNQILDELISIAGTGQCDLMVLDEALGTCNAGLLDEEKLKNFVMDKPQNMELVLTGRGPKPWMEEAADYITEMKKIKHPFDKGIGARVGIEK